MPLLKLIDSHLNQKRQAEILLWAVCIVVVVGIVDYLSGYEISISLFYLGPVAAAAWYGGRWMGVAIALLCCLSWFLADAVAGNHYSHPAIPVWNALIRLGFFVITALLMTMLRKSFHTQQYLAQTDGLTGLYGRRAFEDRLKHDLALAHRRKSPLTLAYVDLDDFRVVNDRHGHAGGDRVLRVIGDALSRSVRESDTAARVGGDEFALILVDTDSQGAQQAISNITRELKQSLSAEGWGVTCSIGALTIVNPETSPEQAVAAADELMYQVKHSGKGAVAFSVWDKAVHTSASDTGSRISV